MGYAQRDSQLDAAGQALFIWLRQTVGVQAPIVRYVGPFPGYATLFPLARRRPYTLAELRKRQRSGRGRPENIYAATKARHGAPPRRVTGWGQLNITWHVRGNTIYITNPEAPYMMMLEKHGHPWIVPTVMAHKAELERISGRRIRSVTFDST